MKTFFIFLVSLVFSGVIALRNISQEMILQGNMKVERLANVILGKGQDINSVEVDGIHFEIVASNPILKIPGNRLRTYTHTDTKIGIRITNNTSTLFQFPRYFSLFPTILTHDDKSVRLGRAPGGFWGSNEPVCQLAKPGDSLIFLQDVGLSLVNNQLQLSVGDRYSGFQIAYNINPGLYRLKFTYNSDPVKLCNSITETNEFGLIPRTWQGEIVTPSLEFRIVP